MVNSGTFVSATAIYQTKCLFAGLSALFCLSGCCPTILDYSVEEAHKNSIMVSIKTFYLSW